MARSGCSSGWLTATSPRTFQSGTSRRAPMAPSAGPILLRPIAQRLHLPEGKAAAHHRNSDRRRYTSLSCLKARLRCLRAQNAVLSQHAWEVDSPRSSRGRPRCRPRPGQNRGFRTITPGTQKVEMQFAHMKHILKLDRLRLRGLSGAKDEVLLTEPRRTCGVSSGSSVARRRRPRPPVRRRRQAYVLTMPSMNALSGERFKLTDANPPQLKKAAEFCNTIHPKRPSAMKMRSVVRANFRTLCIAEFPSIRSPRRRGGEAWRHVEAECVCSFEVDRPARILWGPDTYRTDNAFDTVSERARTLFHLSLGLASSRLLRERFFPAYAVRRRASRERRRQDKEGGMLRDPRLPLEDAPNRTKPRETRSKKKRSSRVPRPRTRKGTASRKSNNCTVLADLSS